MAWRHEDGGPRRLGVHDGGALAAGPVRTDDEGCEVLVLDPVSLDVVAGATLPEPSIARLPADGDDLCLVGDTARVEVVSP